MSNFLRDHVKKTLRIRMDGYSYQLSRGRWRSFVYALAGCLHMMRYAKNVRIQALATLLVLILGLWLGLDNTTWAILVLVIGLNGLAEFMNAAIEATVNIAAPEYHPMAHLAKDIGAGAALLAAVMALIIACLLLLPPLWDKLA